MTTDMTGCKFWRSQSTLGVSAINPLVAFYDINGRKREVPFFYFVLGTTRDKIDNTFLINFQLI
jgi:hypothetical protein